MKTEVLNPPKPILRGHFHQAAFFFTFGASLMLIDKAATTKALFPILVYVFCINFLFLISTLYHRPTWSQKARSWMKRLDHCAIYLTIAGTGTPLFYLKLQPDIAQKIILLIWIVAVIGIFQSLFWINAPKWVNALFYLTAGWLIIPFWGEINRALPIEIIILIVIGGAFYTLGAIIYAVKKPNPFPKYFGYHEIFHILVIMGAFVHFLAINKILSIGF